MIKHKGRFRRLGLTLVEVMIASTLAVGVGATTIGSVIFYQATTAKNDRVIKLSNMIEGQLEKVKAYTWPALVNMDTGVFPPGGPTAVGAARSTWPGPTGPFNRYKSTELSFDLIKDGNLAPDDYTGLSGKVEMFYSPLTITHSATTRNNAVVYYDVNYYKVELVVTLDEGNRIRPAVPAANGVIAADRWVVVTYLSELVGPTDEEFSNRILGSLRAKQR